MVATMVVALQTNFEAVVEAVSGTISDGNTAVSMALVVVMMKYRGTVVICSATIATVATMMALIVLSPPRQTSKNSDYSGNDRDSGCRMGENADSARAVCSCMYVFMYILCIY